MLLINQVVDEKFNREMIPTLMVIVVMVDVCA